MEGTGLLTAEEDNPRARIGRITKAELRGKDRVTGGADAVGGGSGLRRRHLAGTLSSRPRRGMCAVECWCTDSSSTTLNSSDDICGNENRTPKERMTSS